MSGRRIMPPMTTELASKRFAVDDLTQAMDLCFEKGWTSRVLSGEAIRQALERLGVGWKRAKHWLVSPDPEYARKKKCATG